MRKRSRADHNHGGAENTEGAQRGSQASGMEQSAEERQAHAEIAKGAEEKIVNHRGTALRSRATQGRGKNTEGAQREGRVSGMWETNAEKCIHYQDPAAEECESAMMFTRL